MLSVSKTIFKIILLCIILASLGDAPRIFALEEEKIEQLKKKSDGIREQIEKEKAQVQDVRREEDKVLDTLHETDKIIEQSKKRVSASRSEIEKTDKKIAELTQEIRNLSKKIENNEELAEERVSALYKLNKLGKINILASAESVNDFFHRKKSLESILANDEKLLKELGKQKQELESTIRKLSSKKEEKLIVKNIYEAQVKEMKDKRADREKILENIRKKKTLMLASLTALEQSAKDLDDKIQVLYQESRKRVQAEKQAPEKEADSEESGKSEFLKRKGLLKMPTEGKIAQNFGVYHNSEFNIRNFRSGIVIETERGSAVHAVYDGEVLFSGWFKGYGNMMILDHGDHYYTVYAHLDEVFKAKGDQAKTGETIGTVGDTGSVTGPGLHFEVRHHGKPMDPVKWLKRG